MYDVCISNKKKTRICQKVKKIRTVNSRYVYADSAQGTTVLLKTMS